MGHWNYRVVRYHDGSGYGLHEVHYDDDGKLRGMAVDPATFACDADEDPRREGIAEQLGRAMAAALTSPVLDEPAEWGASSGGRSQRKGDAP